MLIIISYLAALFINIYGQDLNVTESYDPSKLLSQIFNLEQNETIERNIQPLHNGNNFQSHADFKALSSRNEFKRNKRRKPQRLNPDGFYGNPYPNIQNYNTGHFYERPSFATEALSRVTEALTSIALYDDFQCVPRLLCEAAGGGALSSSSVLQSVTGLQPLMTLLSAYSGISSNPLFVFGRAVLLGMSSKENPASCRYAYPLCPTDPERLVHYLNNHNGGFFRFFNAPQKGQNIQQFYNHLQGNPQNGNYGLYQPNYPDIGLNAHQQNNGYAPNNQGYGLLRPDEHYQQNYGVAFPYGGNYKIQKRIQNNPNAYNTDINSKWIFPDNIDNNEYTENLETDNRREKELKFPENTNYVSTENQETTFKFPNTNRGVDHLNYYNDELYKKYNDYKVNYENNDKYNDNDYKLNFANNDRYNDYETVYVVRGNGDPNKPEIVKLRPGQSL